MANALYDSGREGFLDGSIVWSSGDIRAMLVLSTYTFSAAHKFIADLGAVDNGRSARDAGGQNHGTGSWRASSFQIFAR